MEYCVVKCSSTLFVKSSTNTIVIKWEGNKKAVQKELTDLVKQRWLTSFDIINEFANCKEAENYLDTIYGEGSRLGVLM